jgi:hypothetical protein
MKLAIAALLVIQACTSASAPIRTEREGFIYRAGQFGEEIVIGGRFTAPADVYIVNCNGAIGWGLQRKVDERWVDAWIVATDACLSAPIAIRKGSVHPYSHLVRGGGGAVVHPEKRQGVVDPGTYRIVWYGVLRSFDRDARPFGEEMPLEERVSNEFSIGR